MLYAEYHSLRDDQDQRHNSTFVSRWLCLTENNKVRDSDEEDRKDSGVEVFRRSPLRVLVGNIIWSILPGVVLRAVLHWNRF